MTATLSQYTPTSLSTMPPKHSTSSKLNPFAPEYTPFSLSQPPLPLPPPPSAAFSETLPPPPSHFIPYRHEIFTYVPSLNQPHFYCTSTHRPAPQTANRPPPTPPPQRPRAEGVLQDRGRSRGGGESERGGLCRSGRADKSGRSPNLRRGNRINDERQDAVEASRRDRSFHKSGNRHRVRPLKRDGEETTIMIKNIPYDCPRKDLLHLLDKFCFLENEKAKNEGSSKMEAEESATHAYDFAYLPIDFWSKRSRGFAFVNFTNARAVRRFFDSFHGTKWGFVERKDWHKIIEIVSAEIQGKEALVRHFTGSVFECETDDFLPVCFSPSRDGSGQPVELTVVGKRRPPPLGAARPR